VDCITNTCGARREADATNNGRHNTTDVLFRDLWLLPDLACRDQSLVTGSALIASGQVAQLLSHLNRAMDNGLTQAQAAEALAHLATSVRPTSSRRCRLQRMSSRSVRNVDRNEAPPGERHVADSSRFGE